MGVRVINDTTEGMAVLYCSTSMWAFGPVFHDDGHIDAGAAAHCFLHWWDGQGFMDPRTVDDSDLEARHLLWLGAVVGGEWQGSTDEECVLCHGDLDFRSDDQVTEPERADMSGSTPGAER
jgi:hypothetical protein